MGVSGEFVDVTLVDHHGEFQEERSWARRLMEVGRCQGTGQDGRVSICFRFSAGLV